MPRARNLWQIAGDMRPVSITASSTLPFSRNARAIISAALSTFIEAIFLPVSATMQACAKAEWLSFDIAILDVNLNGQHTFPIADSLKERGLPFVFSTGYGTTGIPESLRSAPILQNLFQQPDLARALQTLAQS
jgi:hypothetical protein